MTFTRLAIHGAWVHEPVAIEDSRGSFRELFKQSEIVSELGRTFNTLQVNQSISKKGVLRGLHFNDSPHGQAKFVTCSQGAIWDVVFDLRLDSPTYGRWDSVILTALNMKSVFISEGLGHAFLSLEDGSSVTYLCNSEYQKDEDKGFNPLSPKLNIPFQKMAEQYGISNLIVSEKDRLAAQFELQK